MYTADIALILSVCYLVVVVCYGSYTTVHVPSGSNSTLESYLCNGSDLSNGTSLQLEAGEHVIQGGPFCSVRNLRDITITGSGRDSTVVRCNDYGRGFKFSFVGNLTIANMTFVGCGLVATVPSLFLEYVGNITTPIVLFFEFSSVLMKHITLTNFSGFGVYGRALSHAVLSDTQFLNCVGNCSGAVFHAITGTEMLTVQGCLFANLSNLNSPLIGSGLNVWNLMNRLYSVSVRDCVFCNLSSVKGAYFTIFSITLITNTTFVSLQGGALSTYYSILLITRSTFSRNFAENGAAIQASNNIYLSIYESQFYDNVATAWGGAVSFFSDDDWLFFSDMTILNCFFNNNAAASVGGALFVFVSIPSSNVIIDQTTLHSNSAPTGAAIYAGSFHQSDGSNTYLLKLNDLQVLENHCSTCDTEQDVMGAAVYFSEVSEVIISGSGSQFVGNSPQGAIQGLSGNLHIYGHHLFKNNTGESGGAIGLLNNAHLYFYQGCNVTFDGNTASTFGGAIYIQGDPNIPKSILILCAIHFIGQQENYSIILNGNNARVSGQSIYATPIYNCSLQLPVELNNSDFYYNEPSAYYNRVFKISSDTPAIQILSFPLHIRLCSCNAGTRCDIQTSEVYKITTTPGRTVQIIATSVDSENHTSPAVVYTYVPSNNRNVSLAPQQHVQWIGKSCETMEYQIYGQENTTINLQLSTYMGAVPTILHITLQQCDPGFVLVNNSEGFLMCNCSLFLTQSIVNCDLASGTVIRSDKQWIGIYNNGTSNLPAIAYTCPLDYCKLSYLKVSLVSPDEICDKNRHGLLCGHCRSSLSVVFGSIECQVCSDVWLLTILLYGVLGIVLVAVLFVLNLTVTQGTIYGIIFYANVVEVNSSIFFSQPSLKPLQILVSFINLDLGFPLCFYNGMDDAAKMGLQFVFPAYLLVITIIVIMACRCFLRQTAGPSVSNHYLNRFSHFVGMRAVSVLATLIYLSYSKVLRTVIDIFTYATVKVDGSAQFRVWFYDGTIRYLEGRHLPLFIIAIATSVIFILPYTLALTLIPIIDRYSDQNRLLTWLHQKANLLKPMNDAHYASYKGVWRSWLGVRLWLLVILYVPTPFYSSDRPYLLMYIHAIILVIFLFIQMHVKPFVEPSKVSYKVVTDIYNWTDSLYILNYTVLALTISFLLSNGGNNHHIAITVGSLVGLSGVMILATFLYHVFMAVRNVYMIRVRSSERAAEILMSSIQSASDETFEKLELDQSVSMKFTNVSYIEVSENDLREPLMESL